jgi:hypothetical protein
MRKRIVEIHNVAGRTMYEAGLDSLDRPANRIAESFIYNPKLA